MKPLLTLVVLLTLPGALKAQYPNRQGVPLQSVVPSDTSIADGAMVGNPQMWQPQGAPRYTIPMDEQMRLERWKAQQERIKAETQFLNSYSNGHPIPNSNVELHFAKRALALITTDTSTMDKQFPLLCQLFPSASKDPDFNKHAALLRNGLSQVERITSRPVARGKLIQEKRIPIEPVGEVTISEGTEVLVWKIEQDETCEVSAGSIRFPIHVSLLIMKKINYEN